MLFTGDQSDNPDPLWLEVLNAIDACPGILRSKITEQFKRKANAEQLKEVLAWCGASASVRGSRRRGRRTMVAATGEGEGRGRG
jgi:hypothetical protein